MAHPESHAAQDPSLDEDIARCVHCGFCLQACPTYLELGMETDSPRGRIALIDALAHDRAKPTPALVGHLDLCLQCRACETACPSGVQYGRIMETARSEILESERRPLSWRLRAAALRRVLPSQRSIAAVAAMLRLYDRTPVRRLVRGSGLLRRLAPSLAAAEASMPAMPRRAFSPPPQPEGLTKSVALLTGCVMPHLYPRTHTATVRVLNRLGYRVVFPDAQTCCGALSLHAGDREFACALARRNVDAFLAADVSAVIVNSAGCGSTIKEYGDLLAGDPAHAGRAMTLASRTRDVLEFVAEHELPALGELRRSVTYQDSCHLVHAQGVRTAPRAIMAAIPGLELREMRAPDTCCGSAGIYSIVQREMSRRLLDRKMDDVAATGAGVIATANPGCMTQLEGGLRQRDRSGAVVHVIELLDAAMRTAETCR
jgi:glycolate oxidase iron-sulfur subunit